MWLDASTSQARPPAGVTGDPSQYGLLGGRAAFDASWGSASVSGRYGAGLAGTADRWLQGEAALATGGRLGTLGLRAAVSGFALSYFDPFSYDASGVEIRPSASYPAGRFVLVVRPRASFGHWTTDAVEGDLSVLGTDVELQRSLGALTTTVSAGVASADNGVTRGTFSRGGADIAVDRGRWTAGASVEVQRSPLETEVGGGARASFDLSPATVLQAYVGKRLRDPLFGTQGSFSASLGASVRAFRWSPPQPPPIVAFGEAREGGRVVRFALRAAGAEAVALAGDFTGWEDVAMERGRDGWWQLSRVVPPGLHHFGFVVDGQWAIPQDAPGVVEDGWGRENASIVVEP